MADIEKRPAAYPADWNVEFGPSKTPLPEGYRVGRETIHLKAGAVLVEGGKPLSCDVVWEQDVPITLRDGVVIFTDVLFPANHDNELPAIISWSPYGKSLPTPPPWGVPPENFSGLGVFEGADGAFWLKEGYALVNPDARGSGRSGGDIHYWGSVEAWDGHEVVEWVAQQSWSNGKVALYGASWLAMSQYGIAATKPPHLAAIAPWNGIYDVYRTHMVWGGIPYPGFFDFLPAIMPGTNAIEQIGAMSIREDLLNDYWEDKTPNLADVTIPAYVVVDGVTGLHTMGGPEGFRRLGSRDKWIRFNNTHEWYDQYTERYEKDVLKFFDRYLKGISNDWEETPRVRACIINAGGEDIIDAPFTQWPIEETQYKRLYLDANCAQMCASPPEEASSVSYSGEDGSTTFTVRFDQDTTLAGYISVRLWVEAEDADDMDLFVTLEKLDEQGELCIPHRYFADNYTTSPPGANGRLRVSLRELDPDLSTDFLPVHAFRRHQKLTPGEIVPVDIGLIPRFYFVEAGQQLRLTVSGWNIRGTGIDVESIEDKLMRDSRIASLHPNVENRGIHVVHSGPEHVSYLTLPVISNPR